MDSTRVARLVVWADGFRNRSDHDARRRESVETSAETHIRSQSEKVDKSRNKRDLSHLPQRT
jgi:hypothetical protein